MLIKTPALTIYQFSSTKWCRKRIPWVNPKTWWEKSKLSLIKCLLAFLDWSHQRTYSRISSQSTLARDSCTGSLLRSRGSMSSWGYWKSSAGSSSSQGLSRCSKISLFLSKFTHNSTKVTREKGRSKFSRLNTLSSLKAHGQSLRSKW